MSGHSHSANIKRRKDAVDAKRGKIFSKIARVIMSAARQGGADPDSNLKLRYAIEEAKAANMPKDSIERAVKKGAGDKGGDDWEELVYEGYAPGGVALMVVCLTDNRNRTAPDIKYIFDRRGGNLGSTGSVSFLFESRAVFVVEPGELDEDDLTEIALEAGADDVQLEDGLAVFYGEPSSFTAIKDVLEARGLECQSAELSWEPRSSVTIESQPDARKLLKLIEELEDNEDVQRVHANYDMPDEWLEELAG